MALAVYTLKTSFCYDYFQIPKRGKNQEMEWWESTEEYNPRTSLWRGRKIFDDESSCGSDLEIIEEMSEKVAPKDKSLRACKREGLMCLAVLVNDVNP